MADRALCAEMAERWMAYFQFVSRSYVIPGRFDSDDCAQECFLELYDLLEELDPTDPEFEPLLKARVFHRLVDMAKAERRAFRDVGASVSLEECADEFLDYLAEPSRVALAKELLQIIESQLTPQQKLVWRELLNPSGRLRAYFEEYRDRRGRSCHEVPVAVYAEALNMGYTQVRHALDRIRFLTRRTFRQEGVPCPC